MVLGFLKERIKGYLYDGSTPLPKVTLSILFIMLFFNGMTMTMVFSYLPRMVKWFGTSEVDTGYYAGFIASSLFIGRSIFCFVWGYLADLKGRRYIAIICSACTGVAALAFGFSYNFYWALTTRFLQGCATGLVVICKSILRDRCDDTNITLGMSILISSFSVGLLTGPSLAGFMVFPAEQYPSVFSKDGLFGRFGVLFPNLFIAVGIVISVTLALFFLPKDGSVLKGEECYLIDSNSPKKHRYVDSTDCRYKVASDTYFNLSLDEEDAVKEEGIQYFRIIEPSLGLTMTTSVQRNISIKARIRNSKLSKVIKNKSCMLCSLLYTTYSLASIGFDEMFPLFASTSKMYKGIGFSPANIGLAILIAAMILLVVQLTVLTKLTVKYGSRNMFICSALILAFCCPLLPCIAGINDNTWLWIALSSYLMIIRVSIAEAFLTINIMLNNSVPSDMLGSANGFAMSLSSLGRALAPSMFGSVYSWSLTNIKGVEGNEGALGFPLNQYFTFFLLTVILLINAIIGSRLPESLNHEAVNTIKDTNSDEIPESSKVTNISVSYFTPSN